MKTGIPLNGSMVKNHIPLKTGFGYLAIRRNSFLLWYQVCQVPGNFGDLITADHKVLSEGCECRGTRSGVSEHNIFTHFPKDWNCDICLRMKIISFFFAENALVQVVLRAEIFGD